MFVKLTGKIDLSDLDYVLVDVNGVGYGVYTSLKTRAALPEGDLYSLYIETLVREDAITLYGFISPQEKVWFNVLTSVQGVGAKAGLALLSALSLDELDQALCLEDVTSLCRADGVGPKLAKRLITELKDKVSKGIAGSSPQSLGNTPILVSSAYQEAISVLMNLGYEKSQAALAVKGAQETLSKDAQLEDIIKESLKKLYPAKLKV